MLLPPKTRPGPGCRGRRRGRARVVRDAEVVEALDAHVHDHRLDEDLAARVIELVDDGAELRVVARGGGRDDGVGRLVAGDADAALEHLVDAPSPPSRGPRARPGAPGVSPGRGPGRRRTPMPPNVPRSWFSVCDSSLQTACWSGCTWISPSPEGFWSRRLDELEEAQVVGLGRGDDERVVAVVRDDARARRALRRTPGAPLPPGAPGHRRRPAS